MKQVSLTTAPHPQSGKPVSFINVLDQCFVYSDKRCFTTHSVIDSAFAKRIIAEIESKILHEDRLNLLDNTVITLRWDYFAPNQKDSAIGVLPRFELRIHAGSEHIYTSMFI